MLHDFSPRNVTGANSPPPHSHVLTTFLVDKIDM